MRLFLLLPLRLRVSCSIFPALMSPQRLRKDPHETPQSPKNVASTAVYNFEVENDHTYFVGVDRVLVHNACKLDNKLNPDPAAEGDHTTYKRDNDGNIYKYETYEQTSSGHMNPTKRYDGGKPDGTPGADHRNKLTGDAIPTPHVQGKTVPGGVRPATPDEIPKKK
jgi:Bacterial toxin 24